MLQQFVLYQKHTNPSKAPDIVPTVQYPMLYEVSKDGLTHHVLGWLHCVPIESMPDWVQTIIASSEVLLTESFLHTSESTKTLIHNHQGWKLLDALGEQRENFEAAMRPLLDAMDIALPVAAIHPGFLLRLFLTRFGSEPRIDEACINQFTAADKTIVHLNDPDLQVKSWLEEANICETRMFGYWSNMASIIKRQLHTPDSDAQTQTLIARFLTEDLAIGDVLLPLPQQAVLVSQNKAWASKFEEAHLAGKNGLFMGCGYIHLLGEPGILTELESQGFTIKRRCTYTDTHKKTCLISGS